MQGWLKTRKELFLSQAVNYYYVNKLCIELTPLEMKQGGTLYSPLILT
jgi:hypothetical protein